MCAWCTLHGYSASESGLSFNVQQPSFLNRGSISTREVLILRGKVSFENSPSCARRLRIAEWLDVSAVFDMVFNFSSNMMH
jgi:hypothetical protein